MRLEEREWAGAKKRKREDMAESGKWERDGECERRSGRKEKRKKKGKEKRASRKRTLLLFCASGSEDGMVGVDGCVPTLALVHRHSHMRSALPAFSLKRNLAPRCVLM